MSASPITQVTKEENDEINLIAGQSNSPARNNSNETSKDKKRGFWGWLCSCFTGKSRNVPAERKQVAIVLPPGGISNGVAPRGEPLLPPPPKECAHLKTLVLDLDETLVHSSFKPVKNADFVIPVEIDDQVHHVYVLKRPGVDQFLRRIGKQFEVVVFTASLAKYADPVIDLLDKDKVVRARLFREACLNHKGNYVKDLSRLGRDIRRVIIIDNSPASYMFHPENAIPIDSWFDDENDTELLDLIGFLEDLAKVDDIRVVLDVHRH